MSQTSTSLDENEDLASYVAGVLVTKAGFSFAPWTIGGAFPFFRPKWVSSFERAEGWSYDEGLLAGWMMIGPGHVLLNAEKGEALWHQFQTWSREAQGGMIQKLEGDTQIFSFRPDKSRFDRVKFLVAARPKIQVVETKISRSVELEYASR